MPIEGTGLGLPISLRLVRKMGGELSVESVPGQGTRFWFDLALPQTAEKLPAHPVATGQIVGYAGARRSVLIVDDHPENRQVLMDMLAPLDFRLFEAADGVAALQKVQAERPDMLLVDAMMPGIDGMEVIRRIRRMPDVKDLRIIMISASAFAAHKEESLAAGSDAFLSKPVQLEELLSTLADLLPLEWIVRQPETPLSAESEAVLVYPSREDLADLLQAAEFGSPARIWQWLADMKQRDPAYAPFLAQVQELVQGFQMEAIGALVQGQYSHASCGGRYEQISGL